MQLVQPKRNRFAVPPQGQLEGIIDPLLLILLFLLGRLGLSSSSSSGRFRRFARFELLDLDRSFFVGESGATFRVGEGVGEDCREGTGGSKERGDECFFEGEGAVLLVSKGGEGGGGWCGRLGGGSVGGGRELGGGFDVLLRC